MEFTTSHRSLFSDLFLGEVDECSSQALEIGLVAAVGGGGDGGELLGVAWVRGDLTYTGATDDPWWISSGWWGWVGEVFDDGQSEGLGICGVIVQVSGDDDCFLNPRTLPGGAGRGHCPGRRRGRAGADSWFNEHEVQR